MLRERWLRYKTLYHYQNVRGAGAKHLERQSLYRGEDYATWHCGKHSGADIDKRYWFFSSSLGKSWKPDNPRGARDIRFSSFWESRKSSNRLKTFWKLLLCFLCLSFLKFSIRTVLLLENLLMSDFLKKFLFFIFPVSN